MTTDNFEIRTYGKSELAMLYFPNAETKKGALNNLNYYIDNHPCLRRDLRKLGFPSGAHNNPESNAGSLFGTSGDNEKGRPSRLIVRDCDMVTEYDTDEALKPYGLSKNDVPDFSNTDLPYTESKTEVSIDRIKAKSNPRTFERVPAGAQFKLEMVLNVFDTDDEQKLKTTLKKAMQLLMDDYLGGNGSRGYGQISINLVDEDGIEKSY